MYFLKVSQYLFSKLYKSKFKYIYLLALIILIGVILRIYKLGSHDLWYDEAISVNFPENIAEYYSLSRLPRDIPYGNPSVPESIHSYPYRSLDPNPPLYYVLLQFWTVLFGNSEFYVRLLSVVFGVLTIYIVYDFCRLLSEEKTGLFAAFILSISPIHIYYAQEARGYTLSTFLVLFSAYMLFLGFKKNKNLLWLGFIVVSILALYSNYFGFYIMATGWVVYLLKKERYSFKKWSIANMIIFLSFLPWITLFLHHFLFVKNCFWISRPTLKSIIITLENFNLGYNGFSITFLLSSIIFLSLLSFGAFCFRKEERLFLISFLFIPIIITFFVSQRIPIYIDRQLMLFSPFYYILVAQGVMKIKSAMARHLIIALIILLIIPSLNNYFSDYMPVQSFLHHQGTYAKKPFKPAIDYIEKDWQEEDILIYGHISIKPSFKYYQKRYNLKQNSKNRLNYKRIWLVSSSWPRDGELEPGAKLLRNRLSSRYAEIKSREFDGIFVDLYEVKRP